LVALLTNAGHRVTTPTQVQLAGAADARHFLYAIRHALIVMTRNHDDF
jgi:hypothetical protein